MDNKKLSPMTGNFQNDVYLQQQTIAIPMQQYENLMNDYQALKNQNYSLMSGVYQRQQILKAEYDKESALEAQRTQDSIEKMDHRDKLEKGRMIFEIERESSYYEVVLKPDGPVYQKIVGKRVLSEVQLFTSYELCSFFLVCKDGREQPRVLEITDKLHETSIFLVDPYIDGDHLMQGLSRWGVQVNVSKRNKDEIIEKLLFALAKASNKKVISRGYGWNYSKDGGWFFEQNIKNTLEGVLNNE